MDGTDYVVTETYGYEGPEGRVSSRRTIVRDVSGTSAGSKWFEQSLTYDELGNLTSQDYPACRHVLCSTTRPDRTVSYNCSRGFLTAVPGYAPSLTYHRNGALKRVEHENDALDEVTIADHWMPRPERLTSTPVVGAAWDSGPFVYDAAGNIQSIGPDQYSYDEVSRLVQAQVHLDTQQAAEHYSYDRFGNLTSMSTQDLGSTSFDTVTWNVDPLTNRLIPAAGEFSYDAAGNLTTSGAGTGTFDAFNMMTSLSGPGRNERYLYTPQEERIATIQHLAARPTFELTLRGLDQKILTTYESELYSFDPNPGNPVQELQGWTWQKDYVYRGSSLLAAAKTDNVGGEHREHFHLDHLGTPRLKTNDQGAVLASPKFLPYGEELTDQSLDNEVMQFTAHERDRDPAGHGNDLDYMHARYYSPRLGRFMSVDRVLGSEQEPQSWNRYVYGRNSPLGHTDPDGNDATVVCEGKDCTATVRAQVVVDPQSPATIKVGKEFAAAAEKFWNNITVTAPKTGETVRFDVDLTVVNPDEVDESLDTLQVVDETGRSFVNMKMGPNPVPDEGKIFTKDNTGNPSGIRGIAPHETGHLMGLRDLYVAGEVVPMDQSSEADIMRHAQPTNGAGSAWFVISGSNLNSTVERRE